MKALDEVREKVVQALSLGSDKVATFAVKMAKMNWHYLLEQFEKGSSGLPVPFVVFREGPHDQADWGIGVEAWYIPIEVYYFEAISRRVKTVLSDSVDDADTISVHSVADMFVGQRLYFPEINEYRYVTDINGLDVELDGNVTLPVNSAVSSDVYNDVHSRLRKVQDAFMPGTVFSSFQVPVIGTPTIDVSDYNPGNIVMLEANHPITCGIVGFTILVGRY